MITKQNSEKNSDGPKPLSSVKASKAAFRERELRRQKEEEQRQAQLQAQMAEKRRKQEEKHRNARQAREQREKEKLKLFEMAKPMREEKSNKLAESGQKCLLSKKKALKDISNKKQQKKLPVYMTNKAPLLPTDDCYDSDDQKKNFVQQEWRKCKIISEYLYRYNYSIFKTHYQVINAINAFFKCFVKYECLEIKYCLICCYFVYIIMSF